MTALREAAQQALELCDRINDEREVWGQHELRAVCEHLRAALAEPVQEPVAWMHTNGVGHVYFRKKPQDRVFNPQPLYTARAIEQAHGVGEKE